ncbi:hypothetical protein JCM8208_001310 [Rhodotorula glutinis]
MSARYSRGACTRSGSRSFLYLVPSSLALDDTLCLTQVVNPIGLAAGAWRDYFLYLGTLSILVVVIWFHFVETRGLSLEEMPTLFGESVAGLRGDEGEGATTTTSENDGKELGKAEEERVEDVARRV